MAAGGKKATGKGLKSHVDTSAVTARGALRDVTNVSAHVGAPVAEKGPAASVSSTRRAFTPALSALCGVRARMHRRWAVQTYLKATWGARVRA